MVTVEQLPDYLVAGAPVTLSFKVRQHGVTLLERLQPELEARSGAQLVRSVATPGRERGQYLATFTPPQPGDWNITIQSGFGNSKLTLPPLPALTGQGAVRNVLADSERGARLFVAKGCVTCHVRGDVQEQGSLNIGPELTGRRYPAEYLAKFLADPRVAGPPRQGSLGMPNLELRQPEIVALVAYLNAEVRASH